MEQFTNREIAAGIWLVIGVIWALGFKPTLRESATQVFKSLFECKVSLSLFFMAAWTAGAVFLLQAVQLWSIALLKDTVLWFLFAGLVTAIDTVASRETTNWRRILRDNLSVVVILEVLANTYAFHLAIEFLLVVPFGLAAGIIHGYAQATGSATEKRLANWMLGVLGTVILLSTTIHGIANWQSVLDTQLLREILLQPLLLLLFLPCIYLLLLVSAYERLYLQLNLRSTSKRTVLNYAKRQLFLKLGPNPSVVQELLQDDGTAIPNFTSRDDVDEWINSLN